MKKGALLAFLALAAPFAARQPALAQSRQRQDGAEPLDRLLPEIRRTHPGQVYDAEGPMPGRSGQLQYRLKWMTPDGRVVWFDADARTGRVLGTEPGQTGAPYPYSGLQNRFGDEERYGDGRDHDSPFYGQQNERRGDSGNRRRDRDDGR